MTLLSPLPAATATCIPYAAATVDQQFLALAHVRQELAQHFPTLSVPAWATALHQLQPELWVEGGQVYLDYEELTLLTQDLASSSELPLLDPPIYNDQNAYLSRRLVKYQDHALHALGEVEAAPRAYGGSVLSLVLHLAAGNSIAQQVYHATHPRRGRTRPSQLEIARQADARIEAVYAARGSWPL